MVGAFLEIAEADKVQVIGKLDDDKKVYLEKIQLLTDEKVKLQELENTLTLQNQAFTEDIVQFKKDIEQHESKQESVTALKESWAIQEQTFLMSRRT